MSEKFGLKWNDFHSNASKSFGALRSEEYLHDVTLVSDDQHQVTAHKLVLAASSDYFKNIFKNKISNPFLCLDGISSADLNNILDYIYHGEVQIYHEHLDRFLTVAQRFKLEGLLGGEEEVVVEEMEEKKAIPNLRIVKPEKSSWEQSKIATKVNFSPVDNNDLKEIDKKLYENMERNSDGMWCCTICNKVVSKIKTLAKYHVEIHMDGLSFPCNTCGKEFRTRNAVRVHASVNKCK